ncbi:N utilization substance protein B [Clostridia bacterium]|nr:N utilization substance protein B [Clostridia bacterium]
MTRTYAREYAVQIIYSLGFNGFLPAEVAEVLDERLSEETFERLRSEDELYAKRPAGEQAAYIRRVVLGVAGHLPEIDAYIEKYLVDWQFGRLPRVAVAVLRVCMFEVLYMQDVPPKAAMNEAIEIAKHYEPKEDVSFINGLLGSFFANESIQ